MKLGAFFTGGIVPGTVRANKALVVDSNKTLDTLTVTTFNQTTPSIGGVAVTATAAEINTLAGVTAGTVTASKALVVDSSKALSGLGTLTLADNANIAFSGTTGSKIGTSATQKMGFWGAVPVVQPSVLAAITTTQPTSTVFGFTTTAQFNALIAAVNTLIADQKTVGMRATA